MISKDKWKFLDEFLSHWQQLAADKNMVMWETGTYQNANKNGSAKMSTEAIFYKCLRITPNSENFNSLSSVK